MAAPSNEFFIKCLGLGPEATARTTSGDCTPVVFSVMQPASGFNEWVWIPNPGGPINTVSGQIKNVATGGVIAAHGNTLVVCAASDPQGPSLWVLDGPQGAFRFGLPTTKFHIVCQSTGIAKGKNSTSPGPGMCTPIVFNEATNAGDFEHWLLVQPNPNVNEWGFQNVASKNWASSQGGRVVGCWNYESDKCAWLPIRLVDGTYIVQLLSDPTYFWTVNEQNLLALTKNTSGLGPSSVFTFPPDGISPPPTSR
ncbi:hypothetical protein D9756_002895 [Leucocoprinus leucothites]|uniref:Uncharacterized protein n=1 Tax=Leucocoprinus leucothites TaxID=201217 RepID=A0A8H5G793_9AGAR|nr:hypothetical protein D9756_002895 [Leucoagaricus leucothites]